MASVAAVLSPGSQTKGSVPMAAQLASNPTLARSFSLPAARAPNLSSTRPSTLMERRGKANPTLRVSAFHTATASEPSTVASKPSTLYDVLEVPQTASVSEIKTAYRRLARLYHPDVVPFEEKEASTNRFLQIHSAYVALTDPQSRARYDLQLSMHAFRSAGYRGKFSRATDVKTPQYYTPTGTTPSSNYCSPRSPYSAGRGRSWETDQCWC